MVTMSTGSSISEGFVQFRSRRTRYRATGAGETGGRLPLVLANGGDA